MWITTFFIVLAILKKNPVVIHSLNLEGRFSASQLFYSATNVPEALPGIAS
jgi:hypothetical protein